MKSYVIFFLNGDNFCGVVSGPENLTAKQAFKAYQLERPEDVSDFDSFEDYLIISTNIITVKNES